MKNKLEWNLVLGNKLDFTIWMATRTNYHYEELFPKTSTNEYFKCENIDILRHSANLQENQCDHVRHY